MEELCTWCVYIHISPSNKTYVGITHCKNPHARWGKNGVKYKKHKVFYAAIEKYGWDNFEHKILFENCSETLAKTIEIDLILRYKEKNLSYNMTIGGDGHNFGKNSNTAEYRTSLSRKFRAEHPDWDKEQYIKFSEKKKERAKNYYREHREQILEYKKQESVKIKTRKRCKEWREKHPEYMKNYMKKYKQNKNQWEKS